MKKQFAMTIFLAASSVFSLANAVDLGESEIAYPEDYREWNHVKTMLITPEHPLAKTDQGIHHIYANDSALEGLKKGSYKDGSIFVYDLLEYKEKNHAIVEGDRKLVGVMIKNSDLYNRTGGWGFEGFLKNSKSIRLVTDGGENCFACHKPLKNADFVFSKFRD